MDKLVLEFLALRGYNRSLKYVSGTTQAEGNFAKFEKYMQRRAKGKKFWKSQKLSFEINLDETASTMSRPLVVNENKKRIKLSKKREKKDIKTKKIPKEFIAHIAKLGFDEKDAPQFYESKDDWLGMSSDGKILCTERGCKFSVPLRSDALFDHCRTVHGWRDYPCPHDNCQFVAYSKTSFNKHNDKFHSPSTKHSNYSHLCPRSDCKGAFRFNADLIRHEKIHDNDVLRCLFCPYVNARVDAFTRHQRMHLNIRDSVCDVCQAAFTTIGNLNVHLQVVHNKIDDDTKTQCPLCDKVAVKHKIQRHLAAVHKVKGSQWDEKRKQYIVQQQ